MTARLRVALAGLKGSARSHRIAHSLLVSQARVVCDASHRRFSTTRTRRAGVGSGTRSATRCLRPAAPAPQRTTRTGARPALTRRLSTAACRRPMESLQAVLAQPLVTVGCGPTARALGSGGNHSRDIAYARVAGAVPGPASLLPQARSISGGPLVAAGEFAGLEAASGSGCRRGSRDPAA